MSEQVETELKNIQVFDNYRWRKYLQRLASNRYKEYRKALWALVMQKLAPSPARGCGSGRFIYLQQNSSDSFAR